MAPTLAVAVDFSPDSRDAFDAAVGLARDLRAELLLVHAFPLALGAADAGAMAAAALAEARVQEEETGSLALATDWAQKARDAGVQTRVQTGVGDAPRIVLEAARNANALLIVVGSHGRTGLRRLVLGSVSGAIVKHADRPVLVVPQRPRHTS